MSEITKNEIKFIRSLLLKKNRKANGLFIVEGPKNVLELINSNFVIDKIYGTHTYSIDTDHTIQRISEKELSQISQLKTPDRVLAIAKIPSDNQANYQQGFTLVLDGINDPGNLGTIIRTADWYGVTNIICSLNTVDCYNHKVVQSTKGSLFHINISYQSLTSFFDKYKLPVYGASLYGEDISSCSLEKDGCLVMGSESHGISDEVINYLTHELMIPRRGKAESLNVGIATGIFLNEFFR